MKTRCNCTQGPKLRQTGESGDPKPDYICPVCKKGWWTRDGNLTDKDPNENRPANWAPKKKDYGVIWEPNQSKG
jgi:hypothetical protein